MEKPENDAFKRAIEELHRMYDEFSYERLIQWVGEKRAQEIVRKREVKNFNEDIKEILNDNK